MIDRSKNADFSVNGSLRNLLAISLVLIVAFALRAYRLDHQSYSMDEVIELSIASSPISNIVVEPDGFPPLYHLVLKAWVTVWGSEHASRWLSVLVGCLTVFFTYQLGKQIANFTVGLAAAATLAVSPLHIYFSQETRAYATYITLVSLALWLFFAAWKSNKPLYWIGFGVAITASVYTHYYSALLAAFLGLAFLASRPPLRDKARGLVALSLAACACAPAVLLMRGDHSFQTEGCMYTPFSWQGWGYTVFASLGGFSVGLSPGEMHAAEQSEIIKQSLPWIALLGIAAGWLGWHGFLRLQKLSKGWMLILLALLAVPMIGMIGETAGVGYKVRYVSWTIVPLAVLLGTGIVLGLKSSRLLTLGALALLLAVQGTAIYQRQHSSRYANEDIRSLAATLNSGETSPGSVFVVSDYMFGPVKYYLNGTLIHEEDSESSWQVFELPDSDESRASFHHSEAIEQALATISERVGDNTFFLVYTRSYHGDPEGSFLATFKDRFEVLAEDAFTGAALFTARKQAD